MFKEDITNKSASGWDEYKDKTPEVALESIYERACETSRTMCNWYWLSIRTKRWTSLSARFFAFLLLMLATSLPIFAGLLESPSQRLAFTQWAVALLAIAGLTQLADRIFDWSSGWMRYITTAMTMENLTSVFQLEWHKYILARNGPLVAEDVKALLALAQSLEQELIKEQADETT